MGCELRECSTGESGGEATRGWVAPVSSTSFHLTGYPGDLKFPGRGGENPAGGARGGWRCEGGETFFSKGARRGV